MSDQGFAGPGCHTERSGRLREQFEGPDPERPAAPADVLRRLEWSGRYSYCTGWPCCPICKGVKPGHGVDPVLGAPTNTGHTKECDLAIALSD